ncbi:hypothetical protein [Candidatus Fokinia solitaria]|nr:hypothetical protein [Candidatus Fokinia solitaria]
MCVSVTCMIVMCSATGATSQSYNKVKYVDPFKGLFLTAGADLSIIPQLTLSKPIVVRIDSSDNKVTDIKNITNSAVSFFSPTIGIGYMFPYEIALIGTFSIGALNISSDKLVISDQFRIEMSDLEVSLVKYFNLTRMIKPFIGVSVGSTILQYSLHDLRQVDKNGNVSDKRAIALTNLQVRQSIDFNQFTFYTKDPKTSNSVSSAKVCVVESVGDTCKAVSYLDGKNVLNFGYSAGDVSSINVLLDEAANNGNIETEKNNFAFFGMQGGVAFRHCNVQLEIFGTVRLQDAKLKLQHNLFGSYDAQNKLVNTYTYEDIAKMLDDRGRYYVIPMQNNGECSTFDANQACNSLDNDLSDMPTAFLQGGQAAKLQRSAIRYFFTEEYEAATADVETNSQAMIIDGDIVQNISYGIGARLSVSF